MFRKFRILILLLVLMVAVVSTQLDRFYMTRWNAPIVVALYPINADGSTATANYLEKLNSAQFAAIEQFFKDEAREFKISLDTPIQITLAPTLQAAPPQPPASKSGLTVMAWSLHLRWWAWRTPPAPPGPTPRIQLFLQYYDPVKHPSVSHSTGLEKGKVGVVNLFATKEDAGSNQVIIAHELLHTLGATDKYNLLNAQPRFPEGFAEPDKSPPYPQRFAEVMGGRIPQSPVEALIPDSLQLVVVGPKTAVEIGWLK